MAIRLVGTFRKNWRVVVELGGCVLLIASPILFDGLMRAFPKSGKNDAVLFELITFASLELGKLLWFLFGISMVIAALFPGEQYHKKYAAERSID